MNRKTEWFPLFRKVVPADYEEWLEQRAAEGWQVDKFKQSSSMVMTFHKTAPKKYRFVFDLNGFPNKEYRDTYEQFGWTFLGRMANCFVWRKEYTDVRPEAFTDRESLAARNKRVKNAIFAVLLFFLAGIVAFLVAIVVCISTGRSDKVLELSLEADFLALFALYFGWVVQKIKRHIDR